MIILVVLVFALFVATCIAISLLTVCVNTLTNLADKFLQEEPEDDDGTGMDWSVENEEE